MDCIFGITGDGFTLVVADTSAVASIVLQKTDEDKIMKLDDYKLLGNVGETGDRAQFTEYIQKNIHLYQYRNGIPLSTKAAAHFTRGELATALRKSPYQVNLLMAGWDKDAGPSLYYLDYIATLHRVDKTAVGYGGYFVLSLMDKHWKPGMNLEDALKLVDLCIVEIRRRLIVAPPNFLVKIVDKDGARELVKRYTVEDPAPEGPSPARPAVDSTEGTEGPPAAGTDADMGTAGEGTGTA